MAKRVGVAEPDAVTLDGKSSPKLRRRSKQAITPEQQEIFFDALADSCNVDLSARRAGFSACWAYRKRRTDASFRHQWAAAVREGYAKLELMLLERAMKGTPRKVRISGGGGDEIFANIRTRWRSRCFGGTRKPSTGWTAWTMTTAMRNCGRRSSPSST